MISNYQPLHHKYRPKRFDDLVGQESIVSTLKQAINTNRIAPAYLFCGPRGTGKTSSARIFARSLNCLANNGPNINPCGKCSVCIEITNSIALDVIEIDAASNTGVDNIRELIEKAQFAPVQARWKVYVIDECHMLSNAAFNALLKTLEEPPSQTVFILATTDPQRLLQTILSRCQRFDFRRISLSSLTNHLQMIAIKEEININNECLSLIAKRSAGGLRDAESMLDQLSLLPPPINLDSVWELLGEVPEEKLLELAASLAIKNPSKLLEILNKLIDDGKEPIIILQGIASILRDLVVSKSIKNKALLCNISSNSHDKLEEISSKINLEDILRWQAYLKGSESQIRLSLQPKLWLEILLLGMLNTQPNNNQATPIKSRSINEKLKPVSEEKPSDLNNLIGIKKTIVPAENNVSQNELSDTWKQILSNVGLPSTKMLLSQQAKLTTLTKNQVIIKVSENWIGMIQSRKSIIEKAIKETLGESKELILEKQINLKSMNGELNSIESKVEKKQILNEQKMDSNQELTKKLEGKDNESKKTISREELVSEETENFANFFNGKIINLEDE
ncbi:DNA polymerase III subunit gamma/tau [Prochlorococcus marinus]|uniref:DNA polymerase III subunit gamma/tau n=1 Tax=Prochlorococcus marinus TaxID=1219 RepID=UPI0022B56FB4|nr:DNA polymerase III subunit gamma/tau [Prochlorococcus marinus]